MLPRPRGSAVRPAEQLDQLSTALGRWALGVEGPAALIGLDNLGSRFRVERDASAAPRKKTRRRGAGGDSGGGAWTLVVEG